jgi:hypothetical protein
MAGLIQSAMGGIKTQPMPGNNELSTADVTGYDPSQRAIDTGKETVSGQLDTLLGQDSPYLQRARAGAVQTANSRGLLNSSMAAGAGEAAAIDAALPIASADASVYGTASRDNQTAKNTAFGLNADALNKSSIETAGAANTTQLQSLRGGQANQLADVEANYKQLIQASASAGSMYSDATKMIAGIMSDTSTSTEQKQAAVAKLSEMLQSGLTVVGAINNLDLSSLLTFA